MKWTESNAEESEVLVVDDDPSVVELLSAALAGEGYRVRQAYDGQSAIEAVERAAPDLVVSDIAMPRLNGIDLARRLLALPVPVPVVLISAAKNAPATQELPFVPKPFDVDHVLAIVAHALQRR